jgi:hypothetical protein
MDKLKHYLRLLGLICLMLLAAAGVGLTGVAPIHQKRERFIDTEPKTELVEKKESEEDQEMGQE